MKNTYYHPDSISKINLQSLNNLSYKIGSELKEIYYSYFQEGPVGANSAQYNAAVSKMKTDSSVLTSKIQELYFLSGIPDPIRSIFGNYYVLDVVNGKETIYLINSTEDPTNISKYPFPLKDIFTYVLGETSDSDELKIQDLSIDINDENLYNFLSKYSLTELTGIDLVLATGIFKFFFKYVLAELIKTIGQFDYTKFVIQQHSEKNIASRNNNYLAYDLTSEYNQYIRQYETYFSSSLRRETLMPNYYVTDLYLTTLNQPLAKNILTLNNTINVSKQNILSNEYYVDFVEQLLQLSNEQINNLSVAKNIIIDDVLANKNNISLSSENFPYNIDLTFNNFESDPVIQVLQNKKLNVVAANNFYSLLESDQISRTPFYIESENVLKTRTQETTEYIDLDGSYYTLSNINNILSGSIIGLSNNTVLNFTGSFELKNPNNFSLFLTDESRKKYQSNKNSLSLFDYLKYKGVIASQIEPKLNYSSVLFNNIMNHYGVAFDITKSSALNNVVLQKTIIPRNNNIDQITFVDTQVIYDKIYKYDVDVVGLTEQIQYSYQNVQFVDSIEALSLTNNGPINIEVYLKENNFFYKNNLFSDKSVVVDDPPTPVDVNIVPYIGAPNNLLFMFNTQDTTIIDEPISILQNDINYFTKVRHKQRPSKKSILFQSISDVTSVQIYRTNRIPKSYRDFSNSLYNVLNFNGDSATTFIETLQQNVKYYYTFRSVDVHGNISNPSDVFEVKIINNDGAIYQIITPYYFEQNTKLNMEKSFKKYLTIDPSIIQQQLTIDDEGKPQLGIDNGFWSNNFKVRVISKESGKAFDINLNFTKKIIETI